MPDGTRLALGKRRLNRMCDIRLLLAELARKLEHDYMAPESGPLDPKAITAYLNVIDTLGKYVEKRELEALEKRIKALKAERDAREKGPPALVAVPPAS